MTMIWSIAGLRRLESQFPLPATLTSPPLLTFPFPPAVQPRVFRLVFPPLLPLADRGMVRCMPMSFVVVVAVRAPSSVPMSLVVMMTMVHRAVGPQSAVRRKAPIRANNAP